MLNTKFKRSVATLGVVAGLLAAAGPASAQILDGPVLRDTDPRQPQGYSWGYSETQLEVKGTQVGSEGVKTPVDDMDLSAKSSRSPLPTSTVHNWVKARANAGTHAREFGDSGFAF